MKYGCIGEKLGHSFSREIHTRIGDYDYELKEVAKEDLDSFMKEADFLGINVTIPYKQSVIPYLDYVDEKARNIGAVNTVVNRGGRLEGYNTDFDGMADLVKKMNLDVKDRKVFILGTGGTSKTAFAVATALGAKLVEKVGRREGEGHLTYEELYERKEEVEVLINTTPCGTFPNVDQAVVDVSRFPNLAGAVDVVYNPMKTRFVLEAKECKVKAQGGLYMLVSQAVAAAEHFMDKTYEPELKDRIFRDLCKEKENLVLIGMPGCGKSTLAKLLSERLEMPWKDTDVELEKREGKSCKAIIEEEGIEAFRRKEAEVIKGLSIENHLIIATGGGAVLNPENVKALRMNGKICFIDRPIEDIMPTKERPLSSNKESLLALYEERLPIYERSCDLRIRNHKSEKEFMEEFLVRLEEDRR